MIAAGVSVSMPLGTSGLAQLVRSVGALVAVTTLFSGFSTWAFNTGTLPLPPLAYMLVVLACAAVAVVLEPARFGHGALIGWSAASAGVAMAGFLWSSGGDIALQETQTRVLSSLLLAGFTVLMADAGTRSLTRWAILGTTLLSVALNVWETTHPMMFSMSLGRSAGLYVNPNIAGAALVGGLLLALGKVPTRWRELFVLTVGGGVLLTLSRGALLCYALITALLLWSRQVRATRLLFQMAGGVMLFTSIAGTMLASGELGYLAGGAEQFVMQRLGIGSRDALSADVSAASRTELAMHALDLFGERPLTGFGTGATVEWHAPESTHNIYLRQLAEYGVLGAWLMPLLLFLCWPRDQRASSAIRLGASRAFVLFVALWGLFSHNVADDGFILIGLALISAVPAGDEPGGVT